MVITASLAAGCRGAHAVDVLAYDVSPAGRVLELSVATCTRSPDVDVSYRPDAVVVSVVVTGPADLDCASSVDVELPEPIGGRQVVRPDGSVIPRAGDPATDPPGT